MNEYPRGSAKRGKSQTALERIDEWLDGGLEREGTPREGTPREGTRRIFGLSPEGKTDEADKPGRAGNPNPNPTTDE